MEKYIDIETVEVIARDWACCKEDEDAFMSEIDAAATSDVAPVVHAEWERRYYTFRSAHDGRLVEQYDPFCSACNSRSPALGRHKFCPHCGARMDGQASQ